MSGAWFRRSAEELRRTSGELERNRLRYPQHCGDAVSQADGKGPFFEVYPFRVVEE
jgi:hypothetical protein